MDTNVFDDDAQGELARRAAIGNRCIVLAYDGPWSSFEELKQIQNAEGEEPETFAKDAIADILTALVGPAGKCVQCEDGSGWAMTYDEDARNKAYGLLSGALNSWLGDAEDYSVSLPEKPAEGVYDLDSDADVQRLIDDAREGK
jgi:hypothetical protein